MTTGIQDRFLPYMAQRNRRDCESLLEIERLAAIATGVVSLFFAAIFPKIFILVLGGVLCLAAREVYVFSLNFLEMLKDAQVEAPALLSDEAFTTQLTKRTLLARTVIETFGSFQRTRERYIRDFF